MQDIMKFAGISKETILLNFMLVSRSEFWSVNRKVDTIVKRIRWMPQIEKGLSSPNLNASAFYYSNPQDIQVYLRLLDSCFFILLFIGITSRLNDL